MSPPEPLHPNVLNPRRHAPRFTHRTPFQHSHLDLNVPEEDLYLVPTELSVGKKPNREPLPPPRPAVAQLHIMLKLTNDHDKLQKEFHDRIPQISDVLGVRQKGRRPARKPPEKRNFEPGPLLPITGAGILPGKAREVPLILSVTWTRLDEPISSISLMLQKAAKNMPQSQAFPQISRLLSGLGLMVLTSIWRIGNRRIQRVQQSRVSTLTSSI